MNVVHQYSETVTVSRAPASLLTARVIVLGATSGNIQLGMAQLYGGKSCYGLFTALTPLSGTGPVDVSLDLSTCVASADPLFAANPPQWILLNVVSDSATASLIVVLVDSISITNSSATAVTFSTAASVWSSQYRSSAAWINTYAPPPTGTTLSRYNAY